MRPLLSLLLAPVVVVAAATSAWGQNPPTPLGPPASGPFGPDGPFIPGTPIPYPGIPQDLLPFTATVPVLGDTSWETWWEIHREELLDVRARILGAPIASGEDDFFLGVGAAPGAAGVRRLANARDQWEVALPALTEALASEPSPMLTSNLLLAIASLGRSAPPELRGRLADQIGDYLNDANREISQTALLSLGVLGRESDVMRLVALLEGDARRGGLVGEAEVDERFRAFAALAVGLVGEGAAREDVRRFCVQRIASALDESDSRAGDLPTACVVALGLSTVAPGGALVEGRPQTASTSREGTIAYLLGKYADRGLHRTARAHVPLVLARLLEGFPDGPPPSVRASVVDALAPALSSFSNEPLAVVQGVALALGRFADSDADEPDREAVHALENAARRSRQSEVRGSAILSLALVARRPGRGEDPGYSQGYLRSLLLDLLERGEASERPWAAVGMGLVARGERKGDPELLADSIRALRRAADRARTLSESGAVATGLGLAGDIASSGPLLARAIHGGDDGARSHFALAAGLVGDPGAIGTLRSQLSSGALWPRTLISTAVALGLLGDGTISQELTTRLVETNNDQARAVYARALSLVGDRRAIAPLAALVADSTSTDLARSRAAAALARLGSASAIPWESSVVPLVNHHAPSLPIVSVLAVLPWNGLYG